MTTRILPPEEWPKLAGTELDTTWRHLRPELDTVLVVEDEGQIVGCWASLLLRHVEGLWIAPSHRGRAGVARRLFAGMARYVGHESVWTGALTDDVRALLKHVGARQIPGEQYVMRFSPCQPSE